MLQSCACWSVFFDHVWILRPTPAGWYQCPTEARTFEEGQENDLGDIWLNSRTLYTERVITSKNVWFHREVTNHQLHGLVLVAGMDGAVDFLRLSPAIFRRVGVPWGAQCPWWSVDSVLESRAPGLLLLKPREGPPVGGPSRRACGSFRTTGRRSA